MNSVNSRRSHGDEGREHVGEAEDRPRTRRISWGTTSAGIFLVCCLLWALWPVIGSMVARWSDDPRYAHGYLVPFFAGALLWMRRERLADAELAPSWWGLAALGLGAALQLLGGFYQIGWIEGIALLPYLTGLILVVMGRQYLAWAWPSIGFLGFMIPLPYRLEVALGPPLQSIAAICSTYVLQTLGFMAFTEGNVIQLNEAQIGIVEACSGLSMVITFIALSTGLAIVVKRPLLDRLVIVASSVPVALLANIGRISLTGVLHETVSGPAAEHFYHDLAGWLMIPFALFLYWIETLILSYMVMDNTSDPSTVNRQLA
jgi:exosortase